MRILGIEKLQNESWDRFIFGLRVQYLGAYLDLLDIEELTANEITFPQFLTNVCENVFYREKKKK